jgi:tRNA(fMet)-specific endonuclease VapC
MEGDNTVVEALRLHSQVPAVTSAIVAGELRFMSSHSARPELNLSRVKAFLNGIQILDVDGSVAAAYGDLKAEVYARYGPKEKAKRRRTRIIELGFSDNDLWIAATAIHHGLTLVTADSDFKRLADVHHFSIETWWNPPT